MIKCECKLLDFKFIVKKPFAPISYYSLQILSQFCSLGVWTSHLSDTYGQFLNNLCGLDSNIYKAKILWSDC